VLRFLRAVNLRRRKKDAMARFHISSSLRDVLRLLGAFGYVRRPTLLLFYVHHAGDEGPGAREKALPKVNAPPTPSAKEPKNEKKNLLKKIWPKIRNVCPDGFQILNYNFLYTIFRDDS